MKSLKFGILAGMAALATAPMVNAQSIHYGYANHGANASSSSSVNGGGLTFGGFEVARAGAENTSWGTTFGHTALTNSTSLGAGTAFGTGLGTYGFGATGNAGSYLNSGHGYFTIGGAP